jgi:hypothetical protein
MQVQFTDLNMVTFMYQRQIQTRFITCNEKLFNWLNQHGYKQYHFDQGTEDVIYARSQSEAKLIYDHEIMNP